MSQVEKINRDEILMSTNWYGHPADEPMRLVLCKHIIYQGKMLYALNWFSKHSGKFWGTYDIPEDRLSGNIIAKIKLQDDKLEKYNQIFFSDVELMKKLKDELIALSSKISVHCAVF